MFIRNKYRSWYLKIIKNAKNKNRKKGVGVYYEAHHILPKSIYPEYIKEDWNLVLLTAREHFVVHRLLTKCVNEQHKYGMIHAVNLMMNVGTDDPKISRAFAAVREQFATMIVPDEIRKKMSDFHRGKKLTDATKQKMSDARQGVKKTETHRRKIGESNKGQKRSEEAREKMRLAKVGVEISEACRKAVSARHKGVAKSEDHRRKISEGQLGKPGRRVTDGKEIFTSCAEAARKYGVTPEAISYRVKSINKKEWQWA